jgi:hypothetical protein
MNISHYQAFELFQKSIDGPLSAQERANLDQHLATCAECRADVALYRKLETQVRSRHPIVAVSRQDVQQAIHKTRAHFQRRRALKRLLNPLQALAWAGATAALTVAVIWTLVSQQIVQVDTSLETERRLVTTMPGPADATPTIPPFPTPSPAMTVRPTKTYLNPYLPPYLYAEESVLADVDLNCDGLDERVMNIEAYSIPSPENVSYSYGIVGVALQEPYKENHRQVWEYRCHWRTQNGSPACYNVESEIIATDDCEQFLAVFGNFNDRPSPRLIVFRWNGQNMSVVMDERAANWKATQDPFVITTMLRDHCVASPHRCDDEEINHIWNGTGFVREKRD